MDAVSSKLYISREDLKKSMLKLFISLAITVLIDGTKLNLIVIAPSDRSMLTQNSFGFHGSSKCSPHLSPKLLSACPFCSFSITALLPSGLSSSFSHLVICELFVSKGDPSARAQDAHILSFSSFCVLHKLKQNPKCTKNKQFSIIVLSQTVFRGGQSCQELHVPCLIS